MDEEADAGHHRQHGEREAVERQRDADIEVADMHPGPERLGKRRTPLVKEIDADPGGDQRRQANRADAHGRRQIFRPAAARERQQRKADQRQQYG